MRRNPPVARVIEADAGLERIWRLETQLARARTHSPQRRALRAAIQIEAGLYRKSLDTEQSRATHDVTPRIAGSRLAPRR